jgi:hypothetical protein
MYSIKNILINIKKYMAVYGLKEFIWLILFFLLLLPSSLVWQVQPGTDNSWQMGLSLAIQKKLSFGKDFIYTYGPLGFLSANYAIVASKWVILILELLTIGCTLFIIRYFLKQSKYNILCYILIIPILLLLKTGNPMLMDLMVPNFLFFIFYFLNRRAFFAIAAAAIISVFEFYFKMSYGIILIVLLYIALLIALYKKIIRIIPALILALAHISIIYLLAFLLHVSLIPYIISSLHLINDFNDAMYVYINPLDFRFIIGVLTIVLYVIGFAVSYKHYLTHGISFFCYMLGAIYLYLLFKNGFVRADAHMYSYYGICTVVFGLIWFFENGGIKKIWAVLTCLALAISISFIIYMRINIADQNALNTQAQNYKNFDYFKDIFTDVSYKSKIAFDGHYWLRIPQKYVNIIGNSTVDIIPISISEIYYNNLNYDPRPVAQSYSAYDEYLDEKNYEKYISPTAPDYIIYTLNSIDARDPFWDESITKTAMLTHYKLDNVDSNFLKGPVSPVFDEENYLNTYPDVKTKILEGIVKSGFQHYIMYGMKEGRKGLIDYNIYLLLKKREQPLKMAVVNVTQGKLEIGKAYTIGNTSDLLYLYADVKYDLPGKIRRFLFQPPPLYVILTYDDGRSVEYQAILPILKTGVLLNKKIETINDAAKFFDNQGADNGKITGFRFVAEGGFNPEIDAVIKEVKIVQ